MKEEFQAGTDAQSSTEADNSTSASVASKPNVGRSAVNEKDGSIDELICWRGTDGDVQPVKCVCDDKFGWPNYCTDENGKYEKMYDNTHFLKKEKAWESIVRSVKAGVSLTGSIIKTETEKLKKLQQEAADAVSSYHEVRSNFDNPYRNEM